MSNLYGEVNTMTILKRVGTTYIPVTKLAQSTQWYVKHLEAKVAYQDDKKTILNMADQSFFLIPSSQNQSNSFKDVEGNEWFGLTFEVDGEEALHSFHQNLKEQGVRVGEVESRGHAGINFRFWDEDHNAFDVWSEWKEKVNA